MDYFDFLSLDEDSQPRPRHARPQVARMVSREPAPGQEASASVEDSSGGSDSVSVSLSW